MHKDKEPSAALSHEGSESSLLATYSSHASLRLRPVRLRSHAHVGFAPCAPNQVSGRYDLVMTMRETRSGTESSLRKMTTERSFASA